MRSTAGFPERVNRASANLLVPYSDDFKGIDRLIFVLSENEVVDFLPFCARKMLLLPCIWFLFFLISFFPPSSA